jgi:hypothetical protein
MKRIAMFLAALMLPLAAKSQQSMTIEQWMKAKEVHYRIEGVYGARRALAYSERRASAYIIDRVAIEVDWDLRHSQIIKVRRLENFPAKVTEVEPEDEKCPMPVVNGGFDIELLAVTAGYAGDLMLSTRTSWPAVEVPEGCAGGRKVVPAHRNAGNFTLPVVSPVLLSLPANGFTVADDRKSFGYTQGDWYWTYTPSFPETGK